ncbi:MAG: SAM-dependent methyltransferase [Bacteroidetes bacterium]|nr:MAG: SAM-dependent methyltransferase [Bacteroidota bacterium]
MYSSTQIIIKYFRYYFKALNGKGHGIHSPFVYEWVDKIQNDKTHYEEYHKIESQRSNLLKNKNVIEVRDFGAGSTQMKSSSRKISDIARNSLKSPKYGQLLFRIVRRFKPRIIFDLGTSLGITTAYLASANPGAKIITFEGADEVAGIAKDQFGKLSLNNIVLVPGNMDQTLGKMVSETDIIDFAFIDGNHRKEAVLSYFNLLMEKCGPASIIVLDDIHWSREMEEAWVNIKGDGRVKFTIDLFFIGIVFFREEFLVKQDFVIRF